MSYDITFKVKVEGIERYIEVGDCEANTTWNVRKMIEEAAMARERQTDTQSDALEGERG